MERIEIINIHVTREYHRELGVDRETVVEIMESIYAAAYTEGRKWQKAEIQRCARKTNGDGYIPSGYASGAYIVPGFVLEPDPEVKP